MSRKLFCEISPKGEKQKPRRLFCEISPFSYKISEQKQIAIRKIKNLLHYREFAREKSEACLPFCIYKHNSLIRRKLGNVNLELQENKAVNLSIAAPKINGILIKPNEIFSFWTLVSKCSQKLGYKEGLTIQNGTPNSGIGGGMCQMTNLIHWLILHSSLKIIEYHHHDKVDLFPDFNRQVPFGVGTSICYNYIDYRFLNNTKDTYELILYVNDEYLCGELLCDKLQRISYHVVAENEFFYQIDGQYFRHNEVYRKAIDKHTGNLIANELIKTNDAKVMYEYP